MTQNNIAADIDAAVWRGQLLAQLAAERANLLRSFRGIDEETLSTALVDDDWTAKDILARAGSWDAFHTERMSLVLNGRINAIPPQSSPEEITELNAEIHTFCCDLSLEQALAIALKERSGFLTILNRIPDELLHREIKLPWGQRARMSQWAEQRWQRDATHSAQLRRWRSQLPAEKKQQIGPVCILRAILKATRKEFTSLARLVPASERKTRPVCGIWSLKDLVGHITDWEQVGVTGLRHIAAGQTPNFDEPIPDFDTWNAKHAAARQNQPWEAVWHDFTNTRQELLALVDKIDDEAWQRPFATPWHTHLNTYQWALIWSGHEHEHTQDLRDAIGS